MAKLSLIAAMDSNRVIGNQGMLPWDKWSSDLQFFKEMTMGHIVVMGRKTFESIGKPLPGRMNIVLTRDPLWHHEGVEVANSFMSVLMAADYLVKATKSAKIFIIGGAELYQQALPHADEIILTKIGCEFVGDTFFPEVTADDWDVTMNGVFHEPDRFDYEHIVYERRSKHVEVEVLTDINNIDPKFVDFLNGMTPFKLDPHGKPKRGISGFFKFFSRKTNEQS